MADDALLRIQRNAREFPEQIAVGVGSTTWSYGEIWKAAGALSELILRSGTATDRPVALCMKKGPELFAAMLAVVGVRRFFVVIDPIYPAARNALVIEDADPSLVIGDSSFEAQSRTDIPFFSAPGMSELCRAAPDAGLAIAMGDPDEIAILVYTSGSTGRPKGVMVARGALTQIGRIQSAFMDFKPGARVSMLSSPSVAGGVRMFWGALAAGASLHPYSVENDGLVPLGEFLRSQKIDILHCAPAVMRAFVAMREGGERFEQVRLVLLGADRAMADDLVLARRVFAPQVEVWTGLGASETGTVSGAKYAHDAVLPEGVMPLGPAVDLRNVLLLDDSGAAVAPGETGEISVEGPGIGLGYWRQPERSAEVFTQGSVPGWRRFRMGDLARRLGDGSLQHMGRRDFVVKVRGVRVDLGEVEGILAKHDGVRECALVACPSADGEVHLAAFVQLARPATADELREHLVDRLPAAMLPRRFFFPESWPLTVNGKLDRLALKALVSWETTAEPTPATPPQGQMEEMVARIWSEVLGMSIVDRNMNFIEVGGNSLSAMRVVAKVSRLAGKRIPQTLLLHHPVLKAFAALVAEAENRQEPRAERASATVTTEARPSQPQEALWFVEQVEGPSATYNISLPLRLRGGLSVPRLSGALAGLQRRHDALRIHIVTRDNAPLLLLGDGIDFTTSEALDLLQVDDEASLPQCLEALAATPIEISAAPLWRARLLRLAPDDHVLLLSFHHVICDGWSLQILAEDLGRLYSGEPPGSLPVAPSFLQHVADIHRRSTSEGNRVARDYWRRHLAGIENLRLPGTTTAQQLSSRGGAARFALPAPLVEGVASLCQRAGCTPFAVHLTAFRVLVGRYCNQGDFGIGIPAAERQEEEVQSVVGYLVNMLVLRIATPPGMTFEDMVASTRTCMLDALEHQGVAFEQVVKDVAPTRETGRNPLFQVAMAFQNQPRANMRFRDMECAALETHNGASKFDLTLEYAEEAGLASIEFEYRADLFDATTIRALAEGYTRLLEAALAAPGTEVDRLPVLGAHDSALLEEWNRTGRDFAAPQTLPDLILRQSGRTPGASAIVSETGCLDYAGLVAGMEATARSLVAQGLRPGDVVGTLARRSADLIVMALGIMRAGGVYLPLDPDWPEQRTQGIAADAGATRIWRGEALAAPTGNVALPTIDPGALAYLLYTSGSTGTPKGVEIEHRSLCNQLLWFCSATDMTAADSVLFKTAPTFDASLVEMFAALAAGARVVVAEESGDMDPLQLVETIASKGVTVLQSVPSSCRALLATGKLPDCSRLRYLVLGGEALDPDLLRSAHEAMPELRIGNFYGPTETSIDAVQHEIVDWDCDTVPIGRPIANTRCYILNDAGMPQIIGSWGELVIAGTGVARGYRGQPGLSAKSFVENPLVSGERMYRSGDRARWNRSGVLEFAGRADDQVKIRGLRMELGEIEAALRSLPGVAQAVVMKEGEQLLAFVEPAPGTAADAASLRAGLATLLPQYMLPSRIIMAAQLPMLASGKLDRAALKALAAANAATEVHAAPGNRLERSLLKIWMECLGTAHLGVEDDFFASGGHSLLAFQVVQKIRETIERPCTLRMLFENPTIRQLAVALEEDSQSRKGGLVLPLQPRGSATPVYCICGIQLYRHLAEALGPEFPVQGIYLPWEEKVLEGDLSADGFTVASVATRYLDIILASQPQGPFALVGVSFGGLLAFEMARQARERGLAVPLLVILDVPPQEARDPTLFELGEVNISIRLWARVLWARLKGGELDPDLQYELFNYRRLKLYGKVMRTHIAAPYGGRTLVVRSEERIGPGIGNDPALGWGRHVPDVHTVDVPGTHLGMLQEPGVRIITDAMRRLLPG